MKSEHRGVQGSSPRRLIKRTHNKNPTFQSFNLFGLLQPEVHPQSQSSVQQIKQRNNQEYYFSNVLSGQKTLQKLPAQQSSRLIYEVQETKSNQKVAKLPKSYSTPKSYSMGKIELDSLHEAQDQFNKNKYRNPQYFISSSRVKVLPQYQAVAKQIGYNKKQSSIHIIDSILEKQSKHYNIITNLSSS